MNKKQLYSELEHIMEHGSTKDLEILKIAVNAVKEMQSRNTNSYLSSLLQLDRRFLEDGTFEVRMPISEINKNGGQIVHGGMTATLIDSAMGSMINRSIPKEKRSVTAELKVNYIRAGLGEYLRCNSSIVHLGSNLCFVEAKVFDDREKIIATGSGTFFILDR